jgi:hypothetical protein
MAAGNLELVLLLYDLGVPQEEKSREVQILNDKLRGAVEQHHAVEIALATSRGESEALRGQIDVLRGQLADTDARLRKAKEKVLCCPVLSCPVLSCPVLSCPVLSCPVLSCPVLSCEVLFGIWRVLVVAETLWTQLECVIPHFVV